ncbi:hypothetical protein BX070DRAFT_223661 [Coemansia spiralis]|nr:hypothetical protein BX070DRAFT_223661 [Coemansia spiralis]
MLSFSGIWFFLAPLRVALFICRWRLCTNAKYNLFSTIFYLARFACPSSPLLCYIAVAAALRPVRLCFT